VGKAVIVLHEGTSEEQARALVEGAVLGAYTFRDMKSAAPQEEPVQLGELALLAADAGAEPGLRAAARRGEIVARAENLARTLGNLPGNVATPAYLAETAVRIAGERGLGVTVLGREEMRQERMGALLAVAQGSEQEPRLIILEHRGGAEGAPPLVLLGKGLTFDAGGISIKPAASMEEMKFDMCGGAAVLAAMQAIAELALPVNVIGVVPSSENLLSGAAMKPGDILRSHLGKTIEVVNTDAEGRLILADALSYLRRWSPAAVVDAATLTGGCVIALGHQASAVMGNDDALLEEVRQAGDRVGQRAWPLPMWEEYREQLSSDYADIKNSGGKPASSITAGWFLREFVGDFPWAHLDIAGTAWGDGKLSYQSKGATGVPTRLLVEWVSSRAGS
jgi:leucyl aminopeptidase